MTSDDDERVGGRRADDDSMPVVLHRLDAIERRLDQNAKETSHGFAEVARQIQGLSFIRTDWLEVYNADQRTADQVHSELRKDITDGDKVIAKEVADLGTQVKLLWSVVGASVVAGLIGVLFQIASRS